jgi:hypothetical protein
MTLGNMGSRRQTEVTPGNVFDLGLPFVLKNQSLFDFWDIRTGDHFIELEGQHYGWDSAKVQVAETGPGFGPPLHAHPVEEIFVLLEGEVAEFNGITLYIYYPPREHPRRPTSTPSTATRTPALPSRR